MNADRIWRTLLTGVVCAYSLPLIADEPIASEQFAKLHSLIRPKPSEQKWERIAWLTSLWVARQRAAEQGKPILLWEMDGHPLGCV